MSYLLLTGATGLLGAYLLRDLTAAGTRLAVIVRSNRRQSARQRVDAQMSHWEILAGHALPRPVVLDGDLSEPGLGLSNADRQWVGQHVSGLLHNAASLTFQADDPEGEPYRTNVVGTRHVLDLCRETGVRKFHHVSTAYVAGLRQGKILETDLDCGQEFGNDYEISKFQSETLVREATFLDQVTVFRPAIILGDSETGYTTTFHGFYVPLKLAASLLRHMVTRERSPDDMFNEVRGNASRLVSLMNLAGHESKNFVPVDWVSAVMTHVISQASLHGQTYHLAPRSRTTVAEIQHGIERAFLGAVRPDQKPKSDGNETWKQFERMFLGGMSVYQSYWKDDPEFDTSQTDTAAPHLPCPTMTAEMFQTMCRFAIETNFGWPKPAVQPPVFDVQSWLDIKSGIHSTNGAKHSQPQTYLGLQVNGSGGGQWELQLTDSRLTAIVPGVSQRCATTYYLNTSTYQRLAKQAETVDQAIATGRVLIEGNGVPLTELTRILQLVAESRPQLA